MLIHWQDYVGADCALIKVHCSACTWALNSKNVHVQCVHCTVSRAFAVHVYSLEVFFVLVYAINVGSIQ